MGARPGLGVISLAQNAGGVAYVGRLLRRALADAGRLPHVVELGIERRDAATAPARLRFAARLVGMQLLHGFDWILFNHVGVARAQLMVPRRLRAPYGVFVHDIEAWAPDLDPARRRTLAEARVVISNSAFTARKVEAAHGDVVSVVPCPLGLFEHEPIAGVRDDQLLARCGRHAVLIVGRVTSDERYKGHDELLDVWPAVCESVPDAQLFVAGWGDDIARLRAKARDLGVGAAVEFCDYVSPATLAALFERVAVYAMPSAREGFGLVYLEAMRAGVPCIGSTLDAASEVIEHGASGYVVDRTDSRELAAALTALLLDEERRRSMGAAGRRRYTRQFTYDRFRERLLPILIEAFPVGWGHVTSAGMEPARREHHASSVAGSRQP